MIRMTVSLYLVVAPTVTPPPLPRYMAEIQSNPEMPPSYEDCVKHKT